MGDEHFRQVALAADKGGREWEWDGGYPQTVVRVGDVVLVANTFESPDQPSRFAEFIATFDPPTVLGLLDQVAGLIQLAQDRQIEINVWRGRYDAAEAELAGRERSGED